MKVHPISAGVQGGIVGGLVMPIPALAYGLISGHGLWFPINLLAGMVVPGISGETEAQLEQFSAASLVLAIFIHATLSVTFGLLFGVVSPTLPPIPGGPVIAGGVLMPLLWTGLCYGFMGIVNPLLKTLCELALVHRLPGGVRPGHVDRRDQFGEGPRPAGGEWAGLSDGSPESGQGGGQREFAGAVDAPSHAQDAAVAGRLLALLAGWAGRLRPPRSAQAGDRYVPPREEQDVRRPVPAELRRLPRSGRQAGPGASAERQAVPGPDTGRGAAARHRGRTARHAHAGIRHGRAAES